MPGMSCQKGNSHRTRPQKYKNERAFKNDLHDTSNKKKMLNGLQISNVCTRCKEQLEWRIKYNKYKPLSQPKTCTKCSQKAIKSAYNTVCLTCAKTLNICAKCSKPGEIVFSETRKEEHLNAEMQATLKSLSERKRRTFLRYMDSLARGDGSTEGDPASEKGGGTQQKLLEKLENLNVESESSDEDDEM